MKQRIKLKSRTIIYDSLADTLTARFDHRNTYHSLNIHDVLIVDLTEGNKIAGVEFLDVSELFNFKKSELANVKNLTLRTVYNVESKELLVTSEIEFKDGLCLSNKEIIIQPLKLERPIIS